MESYLCKHSNGLYLTIPSHEIGIANRYNAPNMDVEATGVICGLAFIFCLFQKDICSRYILACAACGGLILSGSRINLLIALLVVAIGAFGAVVSNRKIRRNRLINIALVGCGFTIVLSAFLIAVYFLGVKISFGNSI